MRLLLQVIYRYFLSCMSHSRPDSLDTAIFKLCFSYPAICISTVIGVQKIVLLVHYHFKSRFEIVVVYCRGLLCLWEAFGKSRLVFCFFFDFKARHGARDLLQIEFGKWFRNDTCFFMFLWSRVFRYVYNWINIWYFADDLCFWLQGWML